MIGFRGIPDFLAMTQCCSAKFVSMDVEGWLIMQPFAKKPERGLKLHGWIAAGLAGAVFVWSFDLIPRIRSAATGTVAKSQSSPQTIELDDALDSDWAGLPQGSDGLRTLDSGLMPNDPLMHAMTRQDEREAVDGLSPQNEPTDDMSSTDSGVVGASYESSASSDRVNSRGNGPGHGIIPSEVAVQLRKIDASLGADRILDAHAELSRIYWKHSEFRDLIQERIDRTAAVIFTTSERQFAEPHFVEYGETLEAIAKQYDVPWMYLAMLNRVTPEKLQAGQQLKVVRGPFAAVVDLDEFALTVHAHGWYVHRYAIGIGRDQRTPTGEFSVRDKLENPTWYNPDGEVVDADDPENPLGEYWLGLGDHIGIHGTIDPDSISRAASRGCIHLNDEDIAEVFGLLGVGSKVLIRK